MAAKPMEVLRFVARNTRRVVVTIVGGVFVLAGIAMLVLPGPAILVIPIGFAILGTEYVWAARALEKTKQTAEQASRVARGTAQAAGRTATGAARTVFRRGKPES